MTRLDSKQMIFWPLASPSFKNKSRRQVLCVLVPMGH